MIEAKIASKGRLFWKRNWLIPLRSNLETVLPSYKVAWL
jgi:hypothetical protein